MGNNPPVTACRSHARLRVRRPEAIIAAICKDLMGHCPPSLEGQGRVRIPFRGGAAELSLLADCLLMTAEAAELAGLDHIKDVLAGQLMDREIPGAADLVWQGWDGAGRRPASFRQMRVSRVAQITPRMRRITLEGAKLERFAEGDLHLRMLLPPPGMTVPEWPVIGPNGLPKWPTFGVQPVFRTYTARRVDAAAGEMDVDFVIHEGTSIGAGWAAKAKPGDAIGIIGPEGGRPAGRRRDGLARHCADIGKSAGAQMRCGACRSGRRAGDPAIQAPGRHRAALAATPTRRPARRQTARGGSSRRPA